MVGKTNLTFISKGEGSSVQLIQKSCVTDATGEIYKMEFINNRIFAFVDSNSVMSGDDINNLRFVKKDNEYLKATHIIYKNGKYYIVCANTNCLIYKTSDFITYEQVEVGETIVTEKSEGIFIDSRERVILVTYGKDKAGTDLTQVLIRICETVEEMKTAEIVESYGKLLNETRAYMRDNKIFLDYGGRNVNATTEGIISLNGDYNISSKNLRFYNYAGGYFFCTANNKSIAGKILYRMRDGINATYQCDLKDEFTDVWIIPINGKYGLLYKVNIGNKDNVKYVNYANIADDILNVGSSENTQIEIADNIEISSVLEYDGKTYIGTKNGTIYEFQLDYEGTMQRPDVTAIKTLAAKQALSQSMQYTDDRITELKSYIDDKLQELSLATEVENSTGVESTENMD